MPMRIGTEMPQLDEATTWFGGTQAHAEAEAKGHPTLVHFWSISSVLILNGENFRDLLGD